jgi:uncharacterized OB-fold protein
MKADTSTMPPVVPGIFNLPPYDQTPPTLLGGYCRECDRHYFPRPKFCPHCLGQTCQADVGSSGTIYSYTIVRTKPPLGLPCPYSVVYVDLAESDLRVFGLFDPAAIDLLRIGLDVQLAVGPLGHDSHGQPCLRPYFKIMNKD